MPRLCLGSLLSALQGIAYSLMRLNSGTERYDDDDDDAGYGLNRNFKSNFLGEKIPQTASGNIKTGIAGHVLFLSWCLVRCEEFLTLYLRVNI